MLGNIGSSEIIIILLVLIVIFGSQKMTELARGLGESTKELKKAQKEYDNPLVTEDEKEKPTEVKTKKKNRKS